MSIILGSASYNPRKTLIPPQNFSSLEMHPVSKLSASTIKEGAAVASTAAFLITIGKV